MRPDSAAPVYSRRQRFSALLLGLLCHASFAVAVGGMALSLFSGLSLGLGPFRGAMAWLANGLLLLSFPLLHSWLLSDAGRNRLMRAAPFGLGRELFTTLFALVTSLHLAAIFAFWSPSGHVLFTLHGFGFWLVLAGCVAAWLLLIRAMGEAHLAVQTGALGWMAVWRSRRPVYKPFPTRGLHGVVRQPIYIAFALLLWLSAVWTADELMLAGLWTAYCVVGSARKERRFLRYYGDAFRRYQRSVPFWLPRLRRSRRPEPAPGPPGDPDVDVAVIGAGPVGLLLALEMASRGRRVLLVEKRSEPPRWSMAIGITPPSLAVLRRHGLDQAFVREGVQVHRAEVSENGQGLGQLDFSALAGEHPYILSLPQSETVRLLRERVCASDRIAMAEGVEFIAAEDHGDRVRVLLRDTRAGTDSVLHARFLAGCDGARSAVREAARIRMRKRRYGTRFVMGDFDDDTPYGSLAKLFFSAHGSVESFPLPGRRRRWIVQADARHGEGQRAFLIGQIRTLTGHDLSRTPCHFDSAFEPSRALAVQYGRGRIVLCGDAAHQMSPIGGQGMNTGFADAALLAETMEELMPLKWMASSAWRRYDRIRRQAFKVAASRAARGMWLGTRKGSVASWIRKQLILRVLFRPGVKEKLPPYFAMLTIPRNPLMASKGAP